MTTRTKFPRLLPAGVGFAVASALLFGLSTPFAKLLVGEISRSFSPGCCTLDPGSGSPYCILSSQRPPVSPPSRGETCPGWRAPWWPAASWARYC